MVSLSRTRPFVAGLITSSKFTYKTVCTQTRRGFSARSPLFGQLDSKRIIITGGAQGIGESVVRAYAAEGATIVSMDINDSLGAKVASESSANGPGSVSYMSLDVASKKAVTEAFKEAAQKMGGLDVMVNVAGIQKHGARELHRNCPEEYLTEKESHDPPEDLLDRITKINIFGTLFTNSAAYQLMKANGKGGAIINFGSEAGLTPEPANAIYGATKGAVHSWTRGVAREWGPANVRVNAVLPYVATPMYYAFRDALSPDELEVHKRELKEQFPLGGNLGDVNRDLAPVMVFLASDASHWMTGQMFSVDGGYVPVR